MPSNTKKLLENKFIKVIIKFSTQLYIGWVLFIALVTLVPGKSIPFEIDWNFMELDKIGHFSVFMIMAFLGSINFKGTLHNSKSYKPLLASFIIAVIYGSSIEYAQTFIPDRGFDYADLTANIGGSLVGIGLFSYLNTKITK